MTTSPTPRLTRRDLITRGTLALGAATLGAPVRAQSIGPVMAELSSYMAEAKGLALPAEAAEAAKHHLLDTLSAMISGTELGPGAAALKLAASQARAEGSTVAGSSLLLPPPDAALANGVLAHSDETDDSHAESQSHPGAAVVPAALALGERYAVTGAHLLRAVALGYDVGPRVTMALGGYEFRNSTRRSTHSIAGTFGAAAAAGSAAGLAPAEMRWLLDYASQQASGYAVWGRDKDHIEKAFVFGGMPARNGVTAAVLAKAGWTGVDDVFSGPDNFFAATAPSARPERLVDGLGARYEVVNTDIKKWTVGSPIQAPLDALEDLRREHPFRVDDVRSVVVRLAPTVGAVVDNRDIPDICLQHMLAVMLVDGTASFRTAHDAARMRDSDVLRQRAKIQYQPDEALAKLLPVRVAIVDIELVDGSRLERRVEAVRGTPRNPMQREEVAAKARDLMGPVLGAEQTRRLIETIFAIEALDDVLRLRPLLQKG